MSVSPSEFKNALSRFASGVTVVSCISTDGRPIGVTVSAFTSVSLSPPLILVCLDHATTDFSSYVSAPLFAVNVLSESQSEISDGFAYPGDVPPSERFGVTQDEINVPIIPDTAARLTCEQHAVHEAGDHHILIGKVVNAAWTERTRPLIYVNGAYRKLHKQGSQ